MFNSVEYVRAICKQRNIPISKLERDCNCGNGYLNPKKLKAIPYERAVIIADYLGLSLDYLMTGKGEKKPLTSDGEGLDKELISLLMSLTPAEQEKVSAFVKGLIAAREV